MTITATRSNDLPNHVDGNGKSRYAVHVNQQGRIRPFDDYALPAWYDDEPNAALWAAQQLCVHIVDNGLATCPFRDRLLLFYPDVLKALMPNSNVDTDSITSRYNAFVTEYNSTIGTTTSNDQPVAPVAAAPVATSRPAPASQPATVVERDDTSSAPRPAPVAEPVVPSGPRATVLAGRSYDRQDGEPDWLGQYDRTVIQPLYTQGADHERRLGAIESVLPRHGDGRLIRYTEWSNHTVSVAGRDVHWFLTLLAFVVTLLILLLLKDPTWPATGFWASLDGWSKIIWAGLVALITFLLTNRHLFTKTAPAA